MDWLLIGLWIMNSTRRYRETFLSRVSEARLIQTVRFHLRSVASPSTVRICQINVTLSEFVYSRSKSFDQTERHVPSHWQITLTTEKDFHSARSNSQDEMHATGTPIQIFERPKAMWHSYPERIIVFPVSWKHRGKNNEVTSDQKPVF